MQSRRPFPRPRHSPIIRPSPPAAHSGLFRQIMPTTRSPDPSLLRKAWTARTLPRPSTSPTRRWPQIEQTINAGGYGITAIPNPAGNGLVAGTLLTFTQTASDTGTASITNNGVVVDTAPAVTNPAVNITNPAGGNIGTLSAATSGDMLSGSFSIVSATGVSSTYGFQGQTLAEIAQSFNQPPDEQNDNTGITAALNPAGTMITFTVTAGGTPSISGVGIKDVTPASSENQWRYSHAFADRWRPRHGECYEERAPHRPDPSPHGNPIPDRSDHVEHPDGRRRR